MPNADDKLVGKILCGTYQLEVLLGSGGMGAVYRATHLRTQGGLAIKVLRAEAAANPDLYLRFVNEARIVAELHHPFVAQVMDFDRDPEDGTPFIAMELLEGEDLAQRLATVGRLSVEQALEIAYQVGSALLAAHGHSVVHRDIKPSNIFLVWHTMVDGAKQVAKVVDFGISKIRRSQANLTRDRTILGTPNYMAPEAAHGGSAEVDARADQWALAVILYEALSGQHPFLTAAEQSSGNLPDEMAMLYRVVHHPHRPLIELMPQLPSSILAAIERALHKNKHERFQNIADFVNALRGLPISGPAAPLPRQRGGITLSMEDLRPLPPMLKASPERSTLPEHPRPRSHIRTAAAGLALAMGLAVAGWLVWQTHPSQRGLHEPTPARGSPPPLVAPDLAVATELGQPDPSNHPREEPSAPRDAGLALPAGGHQPESTKSLPNERLAPKVPARIPQREKPNRQHKTFDPEE
jgi:serine/threonine-protein kinase